jgi:cellobiose PTS system EIIC component
VRSLTPSMLHALSDRWSRWPLLQAVQEGFLYVLPVVVVGALATLLSAVPLPLWQGMGLGNSAYYAGSFFAKINWATSYALAITFTASFSYALAKRLQQPGQDRALPIVCAISAPSCLTLLIAERSGNLDPANLGIPSIGLGLLVAALFTWLTQRYARGLARNRTAPDVHVDTLPVAMSTLGAAAGALLSFGLAVLVLRELDFSPQHLLQQMQLMLFAQLQSEYARMMVFLLFIQVLWFFGLHGQYLMDPVSREYFNPAIDANVALAANGQVAPAIATPEFISAFSYTGGSGCTLGLLLAIALRHRQAVQLRRLALVSAPTSFFSINEPLIYGLPIVLNPTMLLPWIAAPLATATLAYGVTASGWVPTFVEHVHWATPVGLNVYLGTQSFSSVLLLGACIVLATCIYWPFTGMVIAQSRRRLHSQIAALEEQVESHGDCAELLNSRGDTLGRFAQQLVRAFAHDLQAGKLALHYQPKYSVQGTLTGFEALTRWRHPQLGQLPMSTVSRLIEASHVAAPLTVWVAGTACAQLVQWNAHGKRLHVSINVPPSQIQDHRVLETLTNVVKVHGLAPGQLGIELTERQIVAQNEKTAATLRNLRALGIEISVDDFGMGCTSLRYLRAIHVDRIKLDASLVKDVATDKNSQDIIQAIAQYAQAQSISLCAEHVEEAAQRSKLIELGCTEFQGYLFHPALPAAQCDALITQ